MYPITLAGGAIKIVKTTQDDLEGPTLRIEALLANGRPPLASVAKSIGSKFLAGKRVVPTAQEVRDALAVNVSGTLAGTVQIFGMSVAASFGITNDGFDARFGGRLGDGFAADFHLRAPFGDLSEVSFVATARLKGDFIGGLTDVAKAAVKAIGREASEAANDIRDVSYSAFRAVQEANATKALFTDAQGGLATAVAAAKKVLARCTGVCRKALATLLQGVQTALASAESARGEMAQVYSSAMAAGKAGLQAARAAAAAMPAADKVWADVVDVTAGGGRGTILINKAEFTTRFAAGANARTEDDGGTGDIATASLVFDVSIDATLFGRSVALNETLTVDLSDIASAGLALARKVKAAAAGQVDAGKAWVASEWNAATDHLATGGGGGRSRRVSADKTEAMLAGPLSDLGIPPDAVGVFGDVATDTAGTLHACVGSDDAGATARSKQMCARKALAEATMQSTALRGGAAAARAKRDALASAAGNFAAAAERFLAAAAAKAEAVLDVTSETARNFEAAATSKTRVLATTAIATAKKVGGAALSAAKKTAAKLVKDSTAAAEQALGKTTRALTASVAAARKAGAALVEAAGDELDKVEAAANKLVAGALSGLQAVAGGVTDLVGKIAESISGVLCGSSSNRLNGQSCKCDSNCKFPVCKLQTIGSGLSTRVGLYCSATKAQEAAVDAYERALERKKRDEAAARAALATAQRTSDGMATAAVAAENKGKLDALKAKAAAIAIAESQAAEAVSVAERARDTLVDKAVAAQTHALSRLAALAKGHDSRAGRTLRGLEYPHAKYSVLENRQSLGFAAAGSSAAAAAIGAQPVTRQTLTACASECSETKACAMFNFGDTLVIDLDAELAGSDADRSLKDSSGVCQLVLQPARAGMAVRQSASALAEFTRPSTDTTGLYTFYQFHLFQKQFARVDLAPGSSTDNAGASQECMEGADWKVRGGAFAGGACDAASTCESVGIASDAGLFCREKCAAGSFRKHPTALRCTPWQRPCDQNGGVGAAQGWFESAPGTATSDRVCSSSFSGFAPGRAGGGNGCCDTTGCGGAARAFLANTGAGLGKAKLSGPTCVRACPTGHYGQDHLCWKCPHGCSACSAPTSTAQGARAPCQACAAPFAVSADGVCVLDCGDGAIAQHGKCVAHHEDDANAKAAACPRGSTPAPARLGNGNETQTCRQLQPGFYTQQEPGVADSSSSVRGQAKKVPCPVGSACVGDGSKRACPAGAWFQPAPQQAACMKPTRACGKGEVETAPPTASSDRQCTPDEMAPVFTGCPSSQLVTVAVAAGGPGPRGTLTLSPITVEDDDRVESVLPGLAEYAAGGTLSWPAGTHPVAFAARDVAGNTAWCNFSVLVIDPAAVETDLLGGFAAAASGMGLDLAADVLAGGKGAVEVRDGATADPTMVGATTASTAGAAGITGTAPRSASAGSDAAGAGAGAGAGRINATQPTQGSDAGSSSQDDPANDFPVTAVVVSLVTVGAVALAAVLYAVLRRRGHAFKHAAGREQGGAEVADGAISVMHHNPVYQASAGHSQQAQRTLTVTTGQTVPELEI